MSGHSHWATIKRAKGAADAKRGKLFSKLSRYIIIAARHGGGDPDANLKLRYAIDKARAVSMPKDTIEKAIKKGTGELAGDTMDELFYEGYGPGGVAILVEVLTDNRNRTNGEIRKVFDKGGGNMGSPGCVAYLFDRKGIILVDCQKATEDHLMDIILETGADDLKKIDQNFEIICDVGSFNGTIEALTKAHIPITSNEIVQLPKSYIDVDVEVGKKIFRIMEALDDQEDVQNVYTNANLTAAMTSD